MLSSNNFTVDEDYSNLCSDPRVNISKHLHIMCACVFSSQGMVGGGGGQIVCSIVDCPPEDHHYR